MKISICIPTYNRCEELIRLLSSIELALVEIPSKEDIEVVISDNGSTDGTEIAVREAQLHMSYLKYSRNDKNVGFAANLNRSVEMSSGRYCWLMGSDDSILPESISEILKYIDNAPSIMVGNPITYSVEREFFCFKESRDYILTIKDDYIKYISQCRELSAAFAFMSTLIIEREFWEKVQCTRYEQEHAYTHMLRIVRGLATQGGTVKCLNIPLVITGHAGNEWNVTVLPHFELDIKTIEYIVKNIFNESLEIFERYGEIFRNQYSIISLIKSRIECSRERWSEISPTLAGFGYPKALLYKTSLDPLMLKIYLLIKKYKITNNSLLSRLL